MTDENHRQALTRRSFCALGGAAAAGMVIGAVSACDKAPPPANGTIAAGASRPEPAKPASPSSEIIVYCSADSYLAEPLFAAFTKQNSIAVKPVFDTEATKTTGLVNRLLTEKDNPRADVWWSSEPFGTIRLARAGVLQTYTSTSAESQMKKHHGWPKHLRGRDNLWYGFGNRARVYVYNTKLVSDKDAPKTPGDLCEPRFRGRVGMARPQFGTTRGHMAALCATVGAASLREWLTALRDNGLRLYDGNASVTRAVATGGIHVGLTDTDDVFAGQAEKWPIALQYEQPNLVDPAPALGGRAGFGIGVVMLPNSVARVRGHPRSSDESAGRFIDYLLSPAAQRLMAESDSHNMPVDPELAREYAKWGPGEDVAAPVTLDRIADAVDDAMTVCDDVLGG